MFLSPLPNQLMRPDKEHPFKDVRIGFKTRLKFMNFIYLKLNFTSFLILLFHYHKIYNMNFLTTIIYQNTLNITIQQQLHPNNFSVLSFQLTPKSMNTYGNNPEYEEEITQNPLTSVYQKVKQLAYINKLKQQEKQQKIFQKQIIQVQKTNYKINIDRGDDFIKKRIEGFASKQRPVNKMNSTKKQNQRQFGATKNTNFPKVTVRRRSKSERVINFLRTHQDPKPEPKAQTKPKTPDFFQAHQQKQLQRQIFTPMRPISKISGYPQSVSGTSRSIRSKSQNKSSGGYSQVARLSQAGSSKSSTPSQYLRKGHRARQTLKKQLQNHSGIQQQGQLAYMREYDQWVPAAFVNYKKIQLQHFMNIIFGAKKVQQKNTHVFQPIYL